MGGDRTWDIDSDTATKVLYEAERQTVVGVAFDEMCNGGAKFGPDDVFYHVGLNQQIMWWNARVNEVLKELATLLNSHGIRYAVVKGQVAALNYPKPLLRQSGDVDFYCDESNYLRAKELIGKEWGVALNGDETHHHHIEFDYKDVSFELHHSLVKLYQNRKNDYWRELCQQPFDQVYVDGVPISTLSPTLHALYIFLHLYHHLLELGVGLRQFCDLAMALHRQHTDIDYDALRRHLRVLGLERAYVACGAILVDGLGLTEQELGATPSAADRRYGKRMLEVTAYRGNFGHFNKTGGFRGWKHKIESTCIKTAHYLKFAPLAPGFSTRWLCAELFRKIAK